LTILEVAIVDDAVTTAKILTVRFYADIAADANDCKDFRRYDSSR
jgi:hypothetical protein